MELTIALSISIISVVITVLNFAFNRKDKSNKDVGQEQYEKGILDQKLENIMEKLTQIEKKLDRQEYEIDSKIEKAIEQHILIYHSKEG